MKVKEIIKMLENDGWFKVRQKGSHIQFKHAYKKGCVTVPCHKLSDEIGIGTKNSIFKQAGLEDKK
jgi:predicted RNA binding protein YcfA (HicA-like mRNA interferase family)